MSGRNLRGTAIFRDPVKLGLRIDFEVRARRGGMPQFMNRLRQLLAWSVCLEDVSKKNSERPRVPWSAGRWGGRVEMDGPSIFSIKDVGKTREC